MISVKWKSNGFQRNKRFFILLPTVHQIVALTHCWDQEISMIKDRIRCLGGKYSNFKWKFREKIMQALVLLWENINKYTLSFSPGQTTRNKELVQRCWKVVPNQWFWKWCSSPTTFPCALSWVHKKRRWRRAGTWQPSASETTTRSFNSHGHLSAWLFKGLVKGEEQMRSGKLTWQVWTQKREAAFCSFGRVWPNLHGHSTAMRDSAEDKESRWLFWNM